MKSSYNCRLLHGDSRNDWAYDFDYSNELSKANRYLKHPEPSQTTFETQEMSVGRYTGSAISMLVTIDFCHQII